MITSRLTAKAQTTLPSPVRAALGVRPGDEIAYQIEGERVTLTKVAHERPRQDDPFLTFTEWASPEDDQAYADL